MSAPHDPEPRSELDDAFGAIRDQHSGEHPDTDASLSQILLRTRSQQSRRFAWQLILPIAAVFAVGTAWASATGRLEGTVHDLLVVLHVTPPASLPLPQRATVASPVASIEPVIEAPAPVPEVVAAPIVSSVTAAAPPPSARERNDAGPEDPHAALFAEAHRLHFVEHDATRALHAWDAYLSAAPHGRFAPEARYNRALSLVRLERRAEAIRELEAFASGRYRGYRQHEAQALLEALRTE